MLEKSADIGFDQIAELGRSELKAQIAHRVLVDAPDILRARFAVPRREVGSRYPDPACPARVACPGCVLPSGPCALIMGFPHRRSTMPDWTPQEHTAASGLPGRSMLHASTRAHAVSGLIAFSCPNTDGFSVYACPVSCSQVTLLRNGTNTRDGRAANPYPTGTFTPLETPSFARRYNQPPQERAPPRAVSPAGKSMPGGAAVGGSLGPTNRILPVLLQSPTYAPQYSAPPAPVTYGFGSIRTNSARES